MSGLPPPVDYYLRLIEEGVRLFALLAVAVALILAATALASYLVARRYWRRLSA